jgi:hypothetical protein
LLHPFGDSCKSVESGAQSSFALDSPPSTAGKRVIHLCIPLYLFYAIVYSWRGSHNPIHRFQPL